MKWDLILITLIFIFLIVVTIVTLYIITTDGSQCLIDPLTYGVQKHSEQYGEMMCFCRYNTSQYSPVIVTSNGTIPLT